MMPRWAVAVLSSFLLGAATLFAAGANVDDNKMVCMMQDMVLTKPGIAIEHAGKTYYGCCDMCKQKIASEPARYTKATDPVSGKKVDKATALIYGLDGSAFYFETKANRDVFAKNPEKFLKK